MKISELLFEYNEKRLINDFGNKLQIKSKSDSSAPKNLSSDNLIKKIADLDPTGNKELTFWIVLNYANNRINRYEDIASRAIPELLKYKALLKKPNLTPPLTIRDINQIKGLTSLEEIVDQYQEKETTSNKEQENKEEQNFFNTGQAELIYNDSQVKVIVPKTKEASCFFGINTKWCTAAKSSNNMFDEYNTDGPLYIVLFKKENKRFQFHFQTGQFMNEKDEYVNPNELADEYPILWKIFTPIAEKNNSLYLNEHPSEKVQLAAVQKYGKAIQFIKNPSEQLQLAAVQQDGRAIQFIENPSEQLQLVAVQQTGWAIQYIKNPSEKVQLAAVQQDGRAIQFIENPSEQLQLVAVQQTGWAIRYIKNPSEKVQLAAVQQDGRALGYIKNPSEKVQLAAVQKYGLEIKYIKNPSEKIQLAAVQENGYSIQFIKNPSEQVQLAAVQEDGRAIQFIENPSEQVQLAAVQKNSRAIQYIKNPSLKVNALQKKLYTKK